MYGLTFEVSHSKGDQGKVFAHRAVKNKVPSSTNDPVVVLSRVHCLSLQELHPT